MIYTCIADGIRSPPAFFLKNKYKEPMKMQNENTKRVWLYARIPGNDGETLRCIRECAAKAEQDNCKIVGTSADERYGWLLRPGYREMMRQVKAGEIDCMFQQCFQILVDIADHRPNKRLPRHLRFLLDEFPNIGMIPDFQILISTIRSRDIACTLIYQSLNQLKSQYKDDWSTIYENCDSMIVLGAGGNPENLEFFSKALGKATIEVMNTSENKGSQGSYTKSYQALGRELMTPEEIRTMPRNWCLLMISGVAPFYSRKYNLKDHPNYHLVEAEGGKPFDYDRRAEQSFADFISNVKDVKTVNLCAENNN